MCTAIMTLQEMLEEQLSETSHCGNIHIKQYSIDDLLTVVQSGAQEIRLEGHRVNLFSLRYKVFAKSTVCVICGVEGTVACLDKKRGGGRRAHFNLYGITRSGRVVMMTKDHIHPVSKGGKDTLDNLQTMCENCNNRKGDQ